MNWQGTLKWATGQRDRRRFQTRERAEAWVTSQRDKSNTDTCGELRNQLRTSIDLTVRGCRASEGVVAPLDGLYFLEQWGGTWSCYRLKDGRVVAQTEESLCGSHDAARDDWAGVRPEESDEMVCEDLAKAIVGITLGADADPALVVVSYRRQDE